METKKIISGINCVLTGEASDDFFDREGFESRLPTYKQLLTDTKNNISGICADLDISFETFQIESNIVATLIPIKFKFIPGSIKAGMQKQKQTNAVLYLKKQHKELTTELICENLAVDEKVAKSLAYNLNVPVKKKNYNHADFLTDLRLQKKITKWYNAHPYASLRSAKEALDLPMTTTVLKNGIKSMIDAGHKIPCMTETDPLQMEKQKKSIIEYKTQNPYATPAHIGVVFGVSPKLVTKVIEETALQWKQDKIKSYEFHFRQTAEEIRKVKEECMKRFVENPKSSSRWAEIILMGIEKETRMLGLNAPAELHVQNDVNIQSKEEKDAVLDAYFATEEVRQIEES